MNFLKNLFTVPEGEKVTERHFKRVLISSVCGILLCMSCLMGTTWAWFTATIETGAFPIEVATHNATVYESEQDTGIPTLELKAGETRAIEAVFVTNAECDRDSFSDNYTPKRYIVMTVYIRPTSQAEEDAAPAEYTERYSTACYAASYLEDKWQVPFELTTDVDCKVVFETAWQVPKALTAEELTLDADNNPVPFSLKLIELTSTPAEDETQEEPAATEDEPSSDEQSSTEQQPTTGEQTPTEQTPTEQTPTEQKPDDEG